MIGAGGTAGHVVPALAVADALRAEGAEVVFVGGERAELELVRRPGYELHALRVVRCSRRATRSRRRARGGWSPPALCATAARAAARAAARRGARRRRLRGRAGRAGGRAAARCRSCSTEADSHLGLTNRAARPARPAGVPGLPDRRAATARATASPGGRCRRRPPTGRRRARGSGSAATRRACSCSAARWARARSTRPRSRRSPAPRFRVLHAAGERDLGRPATSPGPHYDLRGYIAGFGEALLASDLVVARAGGSVFEIAAHGTPAVLVPYPTPPPTTRRPTPLDGAGRRRGRHPRRRARRPRGWPGEVGRLLADPAGLAAMGRPRPRWPGRTRRATSPTRCSPRRGAAERSGGGVDRPSAPGLDVWSDHPVAALGSSGTALRSARGRFTTLWRRPVHGRAACGRESVRAGSGVDSYRAQPLRPR